MNFCKIYPKIILKLIVILNKIYKMLYFFGHHNNIIGQLKPEIEIQDKTNTYLPLISESVWIREH